MAKPGRPRKKEANKETYRSSLYLTKREHEALKTWAKHYKETTISNALKELLRDDPEFEIAYEVDCDPNFPD